MSRGNDPLLAPLLAAADDQTRDAALETVVLQHAHPVARRVVAHYRSTTTLGSEDAEDIVATVHLRLVRRLRTLAIERDDPIERFEDYVAALTYNAIHDFLRKLFPERMRLKNRLRYLVERDPRFRAWPGGTGMVCGLSEWKNEMRRAAVDVHRDWSGLRGRDPGDAMWAVLREMNAPILLDDLVDIVDDLSYRETVLADLRPDAAAEVEAREVIAALWSEILLLPQPQRAALLLNLRDDDGGNALTSLVLLGIASVDAIAEAVGLPAETLAEIWNDLPIVDDRIGAMLAKTRQQIINLRKAARARLMRRRAKESQ